MARTRTPTPSSTPTPIDAQVCRVDDNTLDTGTIPIIFVPGVMGSRLHFPGLDQSWDPDSSWAMVHWVTVGAETARVELGVGTPAEVMTDGSSLTQAQRDRGWGNVAWSFYGTFVRDLEGQTFGRYTTPVYVIGYDWRQSNRDSGRAVATRINEILEIEETEKFIMISHSMGGLVTRACLHDTANNHGVHDKCMGIVHIAQPVHGGVVLVRRMFSGSTSELDGGYLFSTILGDTREKSLTISANMAGPLQLLVTPNYLNPAGQDWYSRRTFEDPAAGFTAWTGRTWDHYLSPVSPPGLLPPATEPYSPSVAARTQLTRNIRLAAAFHDWIGVWKHPQTWSIYATGGTVDTSVRFGLPPLSVRTEGWVFKDYFGMRADGTEVEVEDPNPADRGVIVTRTTDSDGTVPVPSAQGLFPGEAHTIALGSDYSVRHQFEIVDATEAAAHDAICHHPIAEVATFDILRHILGI